MFNNLSVSKKLFLGLGAMIAACAVASLVVMLSLVSLRQAAEEEQKSATILVGAERVLAAAVEQQNAMRAYVATHDESFVVKYQEPGATYDAALVQITEADLAREHATEVQNLTAAHGEFSRSAESLMAEARDPALHAAAIGRLSEAARLTNIRAGVKSIIDAEHALGLQRAAERQAAFLRAFGSLAVGAVIALLIALGVAAWLNRSLGAPVVAMTGVMGRLAAGDLDIQIPARGRRDEIGRMAAAVEAFRDAAMEKLRVEAQAASDRNMTEAERIANEAEKARSAEEDRVVVEALGQGLNAMANGDLTWRMSVEVAPRAQQLKDDFNRAVGQLQEAMSVVVGNVAGIRSGAGEISQAADDLSRRTEQQAASLEETAAALDQITATVNRTASGARQASDTVQAAKGDAETSGVVVRDAVAAMGAIEKSAQEISQIIGVIDEIAFQTNLLALNAGVEAARAGDAGRGFAVVASEVRALAQRSAEAAKEIKALISASTTQVNSGVSLVGQTGEALQRIVGRVAEIDGLVSEIAASAQEQATGLQQVNTAVNQMDQVTQQNAAMVEQSTAASHSLSQEAETLAHSVSRFRIGQQSRTEALDRTGARTGARATTAAPARVQPASQRPTPALRTFGRGGAAPKFQTAVDDGGWEEF